VLCISYFPGTGGEYIKGL